MCNAYTPRPDWLEANHVPCPSVIPPIATATGLGFHASSSFGLLRGLTWSLPWSPLVPLKLPHNKLCRKISSFLASVPSSMAQLNRPLVSNSFIFAALSSITLVSTRHPQAEPRLLAHRLVPNLSPSFRHCHRTGLQRPLLLLVSYVV